MSEQQDRPSLADWSGQEAIAGAEDSLRRNHRPAVSGAIRVDLRPMAQDHHLAAREIQTLAAAPAGADVVIEVAPRQTPPRWGIGYLCEEAGHLGSIRVECSDSDTVRRWVTALRGGGDPWTSF